MARVVDNEKMAAVMAIMICNKLRYVAVDQCLGSLPVVQDFHFRLELEAVSE